MNKTLVVATRNPGKLLEIEACLEGLNWSIKSLADYDDAPTIVEDGDTFEENATKKAVTICNRYNIPTLSDDSGLVVDALGGKPGVHSARYGSSDLDDAGRARLLLENLDSVSPELRTARFQTVMIFATPGKTPAVFEGKMEGRISAAPRGDSGFGYDPVFIPEGMSLTIAELGAKVKNEISHRAKALEEFATYLKKL